MNILRNIYLKLASEKSLRKKTLKIQQKLNKLDYYSKKHTRISIKNVDYVNAIASKCAERLPKREHGWHIFKND